MSAGPSVIRKSGTNRSNLELVNSLRDNFASAQRDYAPTTNGNGAVNGHSPQDLVSTWTERQGDALFIPRVDWASGGLREERSQYEITVKLFLLPDSPIAEREQYARDAIALVQKELHIEAIDLLLISFPGISFEGTCEWEADKKNADQGNIEEEIATWRVLEELHEQGLAKRLGVAEFGSEKLNAFIKRTHTPPVVDQINLKDCCSVPPPLKALAAKEGVELNVHSDCTDILPCGTIRELLSHGPRGAGVLADPEHGGPGLEGEITPHWVVRYVAYVRDRGVIENKGYFAGAEIGTR